jgi:hypothetical protein
MGAADPEYTVEVVASVLGSGLKKLCGDEIHLSNSLGNLLQDEIAWKIR